MSCADSEIHVGDLGTVFRQLITDCGTPVDISTATSLSICFQKPDQTLATVAATWTNVGTDGLMQYTVIDSTFIDQTGGWSWQGRVSFGTPVDQVWHTDTKEFEVFGNLVCFS